MLPTISDFRFQISDRPPVTGIPVTLRLLLALACFLAGPDVWTVAGQELPSTAYTRTLLRAPDAPTAQAILGLTSGFHLSTNSFPLSPGTTWDLAKSRQNIVTNADFAITAIAGLTNNGTSEGFIEWSNSAAGTHFCDLSSLPWHVIGSASTNKVYLGGGKVAILSSYFRGVSSSNLVTAVEP